MVVQQPQDQDTVVQTVHQAENGQNDDVFKKLDEMSNKMLKLAYEFRRTLEEAKEVNRQQRREQALVAQLGGRADVIETVGLQPASDTHNKKVKILRECCEEFAIHLTIGLLFQTYTLCVSSVPTAIGKRLRNVPYAGERRIVPRFVNVKIGRVIRWNV